MKKILFPKNKNIKLVETFFNKNGLSELVDKSKTGIDLKSHLKSKDPFKPDLIDLFRLFK